MAQKRRRVHRCPKIHQGIIYTKSIKIVSTRMLTYACTRTCMHTYICMYIYAYVFIYTHISTQLPLNCWSHIGVGLGFRLTLRLPEENGGPVFITSY